MSLNYDLSRVQDRDMSDAGWERTQAVIFGTMLADIGEITEANAAEFHARLVLVSRIHGHEQEAFGVTYADALAHVGLTTNVVTLKSGPFVTSLKRRLTEELSRVAYQAKRAVEVKAEIAADAKVSA